MFFRENQILFNLFPDGCFSRFGQMVFVRRKNFGYQWNFTKNIDQVKIEMCPYEPNFGNQPVFKQLIHLYFGNLCFSIVNMVNGGKTDTPHRPAREIIGTAAEIFQIFHKRPVIV